MFFPRKAKDTDYLLVTEDMKTYGCGCCSIGLGEGKAQEKYEADGIKPGCDTLYL